MTQNTFAFSVYVSKERNMYKFLPAYESLLVFFSVIMFVNTYTYKCVHDEISLQNISAGYLSYREMRSRRDVHSSLFVPLNVHIHMSDMDQRLSNDVIFNINFALKKASKFLSDTIKVWQTINPFVLERTTCSQKWRQGPNKGKCSRMKSGPEFCSLKETDFVIPDQFLNELEVYDYLATVPAFTIKKGAGVENSNFFLFVISKTTSWCRKSNVQAYGSYCRLDKTNRPVAGLLNLCPENFSKKLYKPDHYFNIVMHEMFHILGFSKHLYSKFKTCTSSYDCEVPKKIVNRDKNGIQRLIFPEVVQSMQDHFSCPDDEFGAPLEKINTSSTNEFSSHWHSLLMYSSIMTPAIQQEDYVIIDNITLALLASTGWYKIDFSKAQRFIFGQGEGCNFGFGDTCMKSKYLCEPSNKTGCDISHQTIGKCEKITPDHPCGVYKPNKDETCLEEEGKLYGIDLDSSDYERRCAVLQQGNDSLPVPACVILNCKSLTFLNVLVGGTWIDCEGKNLTQIDNITVNCSSCQSLFCLTKLDVLAGTSCVPSDDTFAIFVRMFFKSPSMNEISDANSLQKFKTKTIEAVASTLGIPTSYIVDSSLQMLDGVYLNFVICPPLDTDRTEMKSLMEKTHHFLVNSSFAYIFKGYKDLPIVSTEIKIDPERVIAFGDYEGFHALVILPVVCGIFVLATFIASVIRLIIIQRHRPMRETVEIRELSVDTEKGTFTNINSVTGLSKDEEITAMCWEDTSENKVYTGHKNQIIRTYDCETQAYTTVHDLQVGEGAIKGLCRFNSHIVTAVESGIVKVWNEDETKEVEINTGGNLCKMTKNPFSLSQVATGGEENDLKVWDLQAPENEIFKAKNVRNDFLDLRVPVWITDMKFRSLNNIVTCTRHHQIRLYDTRTQRRPVIDMEFERYPLMSLSLAHNENQVVVGSSRGRMALIDLRKKLLVHVFKGFAGSIRCVQCHPTLPLVASCGLDRFLRIHELNQHKLLKKIYLKTRLNCLLLNTNLETVTKELKKEKRLKSSVATVNDDEEDDIWNSMALVKDGRRLKKVSNEEISGSAKKKKRKNN